MTEQKKSPEISIIVPVYKVEKYLNECIDSILAQTFTDFELILVDDGSPDNCPALCDAAAEKDSRVRVIHQQNKGLSGARNAGIDVARGNWLGFVDSDDMIDPTFCEKMLHAAVQAGAEMAVCNILRMKENKALDSYQEHCLKDEVLSREEIVHRIQLSPFYMVMTRLCRREVFEKIRFPEGKNYEDAFTAPEILEWVNKAACVAEPLYQYRLRSGSIMHAAVTLKNLEEVYANYALFQYTMKYRKYDEACLQYTVTKRIFRKLKRKLSQEERKSEQVQQAAACVAKAKDELSRAGGFTLRNQLETALCILNPKWFFAYKYGA
jgi:glycosyltransferase involved in cell wall biosynthesis